MVERPERGPAINKTRIDWCDYTWNPLGWGCYGPTGTAEWPAVCSYCYAKRNSLRGMTNCPQCKAFEPHFHPERLEEPFKVKKPSRIFVCSTSDLFGDWVPVQDILRVRTIADVERRHTFFFLTKNPRKMRRFEFQSNCWVGVSVTCQADADERIPLLLQVPAVHRFVSVEPLLGSIDLERAYWNESKGCHLEPMIDWAIMGKQTGAGSQPIDPEWISDLTLECDAYRVPVFHKDSLASLGFTRRDMP